MKYLKIRLLTLVVINTTLFGCASVPVESDGKNEVAKTFKAPPQAIASVYVYRKNSFIGARLKKDIWIDKECLGETAKGMFFYHEVKGNKAHTISTESEFSPNNLTITMKGGALYFVEQYIKPGVFVGGANLKQVSSNIGKQEISKLELAKKGSCSSNKN